MNPNIISDKSKMYGLSKERADIEEIVECYRDFKNKNLNLEETEKMIEEDEEVREIGTEEIINLRSEIQSIELQIQELLGKNSTEDNMNVYLEIRAGAGGSEASIFSGDLLRMYARFAERNLWKTEIISASESEHGGYKGVTLLISGNGVYSKLIFESGTHRVQRVPLTESQGRLHTSTCTIAVLPEPNKIEFVKINSSELRIDSFRASGAGGQHVNKTDSAIRITHIPTGIVVECQEDRSQHKNKAQAMSLLQAKIKKTQQEKQDSQRSETRRSLIGSGDRSDRVRTYNFPQNRITDHRINLTLYNLDSVLDGNLDVIINPLMKEKQMELLLEDQVCSIKS